MELSKAEKLLVAAGRLQSNGKLRFAAEDLIIEAHRQFPNDFSLKGYPRFPNSNAVLTHLMGKKARLIVRGWMEKTGTNQYRLTPKGVQDLELLVGAQSCVPASSIRIEREKEDEFGRLLTSVAYEMFRSGQKDRITFHQFSRFAGLSARDKWQKVEGKLKSLEYSVGEVVKVGESGQSLNIHFRDRNYHFTPEDLRSLRALYQYLFEMFKKEMEEWKRNAFA